jgi:hypothetical protein
LNQRLIGIEMKKYWYLFVIPLILVACRSISDAPPPSPDTLYNPDQRRLQAGEMVLAANEDDIPAIFAEDDLFVDARNGALEWQDEDLVIGLEFNGEARAYPVRIMSLHEVVNDTVGGQPVLITWCPLCYSALVFDRVVDGRELTFGVSGYLYNNNLVMYDHQSNTFWSQLLAQAIRGAYRGQTLSVLPSQLTSWKEWMAVYPETSVMSAEKLGHNASEVIDPYSGYYTTSSAGIMGWREKNDVLAVKDLVVGLVVGEQVKAFPLEAVREQGAINDQLMGLAFVLVYDQTLDTVSAFHREVSDLILTFDLSEEGVIVDHETKSAWDLQTGLAVEGKLQGQKLVRMAAPLVFWFAWNDLHPSSEVYLP